MGRYSRMLTIPAVFAVLLLAGCVYPGGGWHHDRYGGYHDAPHYGRYDNSGHYSGYNNAYRSSGYRSNPMNGYGN